MTKLERLSALPGVDRLEPYHDEILARLGNAVASLGQYLFQGLSSTTRAISVLVSSLPT